MKLDSSEISLKLIRYRKQILLACFGLLITFAIGIGIVGFLAYQTEVFAKDKVSAIQIDAKNTLFEASVTQVGFVEGFLLNLASGWVQKNLASTETVRFGAGLSCFDALGGPNPKVIIDHVKAQVDDATLLARLNELSASLDKSAPQANGSASCASWILRG